MERIFMVKCSKYKPEQLTPELLEQLAEESAVEYEATKKYNGKPQKMERLLCDGEEETENIRLLNEVNELRAENSRLKSDIRILQADIKLIRGVVNGAI